MELFNFIWLINIEVALDVSNLSDPNINPFRF